MVIEGNCKINLSLNIDGTLPNGYHSIKTIFQEVSLSDKISLTFGKSGVSLSSSSLKIPTDSKNIAYRAAELFYEKTSISDGVHINLEKHIPSQAGLGGGSTDGAAVLKGLNEHYGYPLSSEELIALGAQLGADVPFFIVGKTAFAEGIGEIITPVENSIKADILIVKPDVNISTPWAYKKLDEMGFIPVDTGRTLSAINRGDADSLWASLGNVFEQVAEAEFPIISEIKKDMLSLGAKASMMSGSGSAVFGIFDADTIDRAYDFFIKSYADAFKCKMI